MLITMKKILAIVVLGLLLSSNASAGMVYLKCYWKTNYYSSVAENPLDKWATTEYVNSDTPGYFAFDKRFVYYRYDNYEAEFKYKIPITSYSERKIEFYDPDDKEVDIIDRERGIIFFDNKVVTQGYRCSKISKQDLPPKKEIEQKF